VHSRGPISEISESRLPCVPEIYTAGEFGSRSVLFYEVRVPSGNEESTDEANESE